MICAESLIKETVQQFQPPFFPLSPTPFFLLSSHLEIKVFNVLHLETIIKKEEIIWNTNTWLQRYKSLELHHCFYSVCLTITLKKENRFIHDNNSLKCSYECRIKLYSFIHTSVASVFYNRGWYEIIRTQNISYRFYQGFFLL